MIQTQLVNPTLTKQVTFTKQSFPISKHFILAYSSFSFSNIYKSYSSRLSSISLSQTILSSIYIQCILSITFIWPQTSFHMTSNLLSYYWTFKQVHSVSLFPFIFNHYVSILSLSYTQSLFPLLLSDSKQSIFQPFYSNINSTLISIIEYHSYSTKVSIEWIRP